MNFKNYANQDNVEATTQETRNKRVSFQEVPQIIPDIISQPISVPTSPVVTTLTESIRKDFHTIDEILERVVKDDGSVEYLVSWVGWDASANQTLPFKLMNKASKQVILDKWPGLSTTKEIIEKPKKVNTVPVPVPQEGVRKSERLIAKNV